MTRRMLSGLACRLRPLLLPEGLVGRALAPACLALAGLLLVALPTSWLAQRRAVVERRAAEAGVVAASIALGVPGEAHEAWVQAFPAEQRIEDWAAAPRAVRDLRAGLGRAAQVGGFAAPISTLRVRAAARDTLTAAPGARKEGALERMVTTAPGPTWRERVDYLPAMELAVLQGEAVTSGVLAGADGRAVYGWAPIVDGFGATTALVQVEAPIDAALAGVLRAHLAAAALLALSLGGTLALGAQRLRRSTSALEALGATARAAVVEEPYLADDTTREVLALVLALEERRAEEERTRAELTAETARARRAQARASRELHGHERLTLVLAREFPTSLRRLAAAVGRVPAEAVPAEERAPLREAVLETCRLARVLDQQRELAELRGGTRRLRPRSVLLQELVEAAVEGSRRQARERDVDLRVVLGSSLPAEVETDPDVLRRCLSVFSENAVRTVARHGGGTVSLRVKRLEGTAGDVVRFELCDSAPGLGEAQADAMFEPFPPASGQHPRREHSLDASLAIARELLHLHGAEIALESVPGSGTRLSFTVSFLGATRRTGLRPALPSAASPARPGGGPAEDGTFELELGLIQAGTTQRA